MGTNFYIGLAGSTIYNVAEQAIDLANEHDCNVQFNFNGTDIVCIKHDAPSQIVIFYEMARRGK